MSELYAENIIIERTWNDIFSGVTDDETIGGVISNGGDIQSGGRYVGPTLEGAFYRSAVNGSRLEILPDANTGIIVYNASNTKIFEILVAGTNVGDIVMGNYAGGQGLFWDQSAGTFTVKGGLIVDHLDIPDLVTANSFHVDTSGNTWWGATVIGSAVAKVLNTGAATFTNITITGLQAGSMLDGQYILANSIGSAAANLALQSWTQTCVFSSTDLDTVSWTSGALTLADGTAYSIGAGNTGNMSAPTYIYLDINVSTTAYQVTTTAANTVGNGKKLVAVANNGATAATFQAFGGIGGNFISGDQIAANSIVANKMSVSVLSAIAADLGTITAGTITLSASGNIKSGQTAYNTGTGFWLGIDVATPKFSIGDGTSGNSMTWDGSELLVKGSALAFSVYFGDGSDGDVTISVNTTLSSDKFYNSLTVNNGVSLNTNSFRVFVKGTLTNNGTIHCNGNAGGNGTNASGATKGTGGAAATAISDGSLAGVAAGKAGGDGANGYTNTDHAGDNGSNGTAGTSAAKGLCANGVAGANGGNGGNGSGYGGGIGGSGAAAGTKTGTVYNLPYTVFAAYQLYDFNGSDFIRSSANSGSSGGGASGGASGTGSYFSGGGGGGGAPGQAAGICEIFAKTIINSGTISAIGGLGGNGANGGNASGGNCGGGGGGGAAPGGSGGFVCLVYNSLTNTGTISVAGGLAGSYGYGGSGSGSGTTGSTGSSATAGNTGKILQLQC